MQGISVTHDGVIYVGGDLIPCTNDEAAMMPHAVQAIETAAPVVEGPAVVSIPLAELAMVPDVSADAFTAKAEETKPGKAPSKRSK